MFDCPKLGAFGTFGLLSEQVYLDHTLVKF